MDIVTNFAFEDHLVRMVEIDGEPWFVAKDACGILDVQNVSQAVAVLDDDEKAAICISYTSSNGVSQERETLVVSEGGLYTLTLRSRAATTPGAPAHRFRKWVTAELLPAIRKTGKYGVNGDGKVAGFDLTDLGFRLQMVRETRLTMGRKAAQPMLLALLADAGMRVAQEAPRAQAQHGVDFVQTFLDDRTEDAPGGRVNATALFDAYKAWASETEAPAMTLTAFGRTLTALGLNRQVSSIVYYVGLRLKHRTEISG